MAERDRVPSGKASGAKSIGLGRDLAQRPKTKKMSDLQHTSVQHLHHKARVRARTRAPHTRAHTLVSHVTHRAERSGARAVCRSAHQNEKKSVTYNTRAHNTCTTKHECAHARVLLTHGHALSCLPRPPIFPPPQVFLHFFCGLNVLPAHHLFDPAVSKWLDLKPSSVTPCACFFVIFPTE